MKRINISKSLSVCVLIIFLIAGCVKKQRPKIEDTKTYNDRGLTQVKKGNYDQAISDFNKAIDLNPRDADVYNHRGNAYSLKRQFEQAISDYTRAIELNPRFADAYNNRGTAYKNKSQYDKFKAI